MNRRSLISAAGAGCGSRVMRSLIAARAASAASSPIASPTAAEPPLIGGAVPLFDAGRAGELSNVALDPYTRYDAKSGMVAIFRNNTGSDIYEAAVVVSAFAPDASLFAVTDAVLMYPRLIHPGLLGFAFPNFGDARLLGDETFTAQTSGATTSTGYNDYYADFAIVSAKKVQNRIVGVARNIGPKAFTPLSIQGLTFRHGSFNRVFRHYTDGLFTVLPGQDFPFQQTHVPDVFDDFMVSLIGTSF